VPLLLDHFARAQAALGLSQPGFDTLLALNQLPRWVPDAASRQKILTENPARLCGFPGT
jgi:predicted TIM-barrel fold metal-dependent hydrolase